MDLVTKQNIICTKTLAGMCSQFAVCVFLRAAPNLAGQGGKGVQPEGGSKVVCPPKGLLEAGQIPWLVARQTHSLRLAEQRVSDFSLL